MSSNSGTTNDHIIDLTKLEYFQPFEGLKAKLFHSETQTISFWGIDKDAVLPEHKHINEQVSFVTKGVLALTIDGVTTEMKPGMVAHIPPNVLHSAVAITDVEVTDVFYPIRDDFPK